MKHNPLFISTAQTYSISFGFWLWCRLRLVSTRSWDACFIILGFTTCTLIFVDISFSCKQYKLCTTTVLTTHLHLGNVKRKSTVDEYSGLRFLYKIWNLCTHWMNAHKSFGSMKSDDSLTECSNRVQRHLLLASKILEINPLSFRR